MHRICICIGKYWEVLIGKNVKVYIYLEAILFAKEEMNYRSIIKCTLPEQCGKATPLYKTGWAEEP